MSLAGPAVSSATGDATSRHGGSLAPPFEPTPTTTSGDETTTSDKKKHKKRTFFGFGKKKADHAHGDVDTTATATATTSTAAPTSAPAAATATQSAVLPTTTGSKPPTTPGQTAVKDVKPTSTSPIQTINTTGTGIAITGAGAGAAGSTYYVLPASPVRSLAALSSSPRMSSPAGSQIFERDVQETSSILIPNSPAIPAHITTENHIPPVLDASSEAITDNHLDPDTVEIITHSQHQPAALTVAGLHNNNSNNPGGPGSSQGMVRSPSGTSIGPWVDDVASSFVGGDKDDSASNYGSFDTTDVRRLSFISFADVVQAEHQQQAQASSTTTTGLGTSPQDSMHLAGLTSLAALGAMNRNRSPSPMRSPTGTTTTGGFGTSPPTSKSGSIKGLEMSPSRKAVSGGPPGPSPPGPSGLPAAGGPPTTTSSAMGSPTMSAVGAPSSSGSTLLTGGELTVETMTQALRRTGSGDLGPIRSIPHSPIEGPTR